MDSKISSLKMQIVSQRDRILLLLKIAYVRNDTVSVAKLWKNFQINKINDELAWDLNDDEKTFLNSETLNYTDA